MKKLAILCGIILSLIISQTVSAKTINVPVLGKTNAPVIVEEFFDYQCPACQFFHQEIFPTIKKKYIDTGKVKFVYYNFPLSSIHKDAYPAAKFAECSYRKGGNSKFLKIKNKLYSIMTDGKFDYDTMSKFATSIGINKNNLKKCFDKDTYKNNISKDIKYGEKAGITGTPGFIVNGTVIIGAGEELEETIQSELTK